MTTTDTTKMTDTDLKRLAREYDRVNNEGGDGYNPYRNEINDRERAANDADPHVRLDRLKCRLRATDSLISREWADPDANAAEIADIKRAARLHAARR